MIEKSLQTFFIKCLNPIYKYTKKISRKKRDAIAGSMFFLIILFIDMDRSALLREIFIADHFQSMFSRQLVCTVMLLISALISIDRDPERVNWRRSVILMQLLTGAGMIIISFIHPVGSGYRLMGFELVLIFPMLYFIWNNRKDYDELFRLLAYAMLAAGLIMFLITMAVARQGLIDMSENNGLRFIGIMLNANSYSLVGLELYLGGVYLLVTEKVSIPKGILCWVSIGLGLGIILTGQMRIAAFAVLVCSIVAVLFKTCYFREGLNKKKLARIAAGCMIALVQISVVYATVDVYDRTMEAKDSEAAIEDETSIADRFAAPSEGGLERYSSGRLWIWKNYWSELNWTGNDYDQFDKEKMTGPHFGYAHNVFLEVAYRFGIPLGIAFLIYMLVSGIVCLRYLFYGKDHKEPYLLFPVLASIVFVLESILDCALLPFFQPEALAYYVSIAAVIDMETTKKQNG